MKYYIDIIVRENEIVTKDQLMSVLYTKAHKAIIKINSNQVGVSFPDCNIKPGYLLRLHGDKVDLNFFQIANWLEEIFEYCEVSNIKIIPDNVEHRTISRIRPTMSNSKMRRLELRGSLNRDGVSVSRYKTKMFSLGLDNPYFELKSGSTHQRYKFFIKLGNLSHFSVEGKFDSYGLSNVATIAWF